MPLWKICSSERRHNKRLRSGSAGASSNASSPGVSQLHAASLALTNANGLRCTPICFACCFVVFGKCNLLEYTSLSEKSQPCPVGAVLCSAGALNNDMQYYLVTKVLQFLCPTCTTTNQLRECPQRSMVQLALSLHSLSSWQGGQVNA